MQQWICLNQVESAMHTTRTNRIHSHEFIGLQISKTGDAIKRDAAAAISSIIPYDVPKIGIAPLHVDKTCLLRATQDARVVSDGWSSFGTTGALHVTDH